MRRWLSTLWLAMWAMPGALAVAAGTTTWSTLSPPERELLASWQSRWDALGAEHRQRLLDNTQAWIRLTPEERQQFEVRIEHWDALPPPERARLRERHVQLLQMSAQERERMRLTVRRFKALPPEQQTRLRDAFARLAPADTRALLQRAQADHAADTARRSFPFVPEAERGATLRMLQDLGEEDRRRLRELAPRLAPDQREELRRQLLQRDVDGRARLLRERLGR